VSTEQIGLSAAVLALAAALPVAAVSIQLPHADALPRVCGCSTQPRTHHRRMQAPRYPVGVLDFSGRGNFQQCAAEYLNLLPSRLFLDASDKQMPYELQQLPVCCQFRGLLSVIVSVCMRHAAVPHTLPVVAQACDSRFNFLVLPFPAQWLWCTRLTRPADESWSLRTASRTGCTRLRGLSASQTAVTVSRAAKSMSHTPVTVRLSNCRWTSYYNFSAMIPTSEAARSRRRQDRVVYTGGKDFKHVNLPEILDMAPYITRAAATVAEERAPGGPALTASWRPSCTLGPTVKSGHYVAYRRAESRGRGQRCRVCMGALERQRHQRCDLGGTSAAAHHIAFYEIVNVSARRAVFPADSLSVAGRLTRKY